MRSVVLAAWLVLAPAGAAAAQPGITEPLPAAPPPQTEPLLAAPPSQAEPPLAAPQPRAEPVNETAALGLSLGGTVAAWALLLAGAHEDAGGPFAVGAAGVIFAPSFGHWYAHAFASRGLGLRLAGIGTFAVAVALGAQCEDDCDNRVPGGIALVALGLVAAGTIDDIVTAPGAARRYNQRVQAMNLFPTLQHGGGGLLFTARF